MTEMVVAQQSEADFAEVVNLITAARQHAYQAGNTTLIDLYWQAEAFISKKIGAAEWGDGVVEALARDLAITQPNLQGFTRRNLFRMRQFYEAYQNDQIVSPLVNSPHGQRKISCVKSMKFSMAMAKNLKSVMLDYLRKADNLVSIIDTTNLLHIIRTNQQIKNIANKTTKIPAPNSCLIDLMQHALGTPRRCAAT